MQISRLLGLFLVCGCLSFQANAQTLDFDSVYADFESLGVDQGLAAGLVLQLAQDTSGYLWMGTSQGLNRYDGYRVKIYRHKDEDPYSLLGNEVVSIFADSRNLLWLWIRKEGYCVFNPRTERAYPINYVVEEPTSEDSHGNIWSFGKDSLWYVTTAKSIPSYRADAAEWASLKPAPAASRYRGLHLHKAFQIIHGPNNRLWALSTDSVKAYRLNESQGTAVPLFAFALSSFDRPSFGIGRIVWHKKRDQLFLFSQKGFHAFHAETGEILDSGQFPHRAMESVDDLMVDARGRIWIDGLYRIFRFSPETGELSRIFDADPAFQNSAISHIDLSYQIYRDRQDNIWFATSGYGAYRFVARNERFHYWGDMHQGPSIHSLGINKAGDLVMMDKTVSKILDRETGRVRDLIHQGPRSYNGEPIFYGSGWLDGRGNYWRESLFAGANRTFGFRLNPQGQFQDFFRYRDRTLPVPFWTYYLFDEGHYCWTMLPDGGLPLNEGRRVTLFRSDTSGTGKVDTFGWRSTSKGQPMYRPYTKTQTPDGNIWIGFYDGGLLRFDPDTEHWTHYEHDANDPLSISDDRLLSILPDPTHPDSLLWIGTTTGLNRMDVHHGTFQKFGLADGLPDEVIYGILSDDHNNFWLSTNKGLCLFDPKTGSTRNFTAADGLQSNEFNRHAYIKNEEGTMFFGGVGGLTWFDPEDFYQQEPAANVVINGIRLFNEPEAYNPVEESGSKGDFRLEAPMQYMQSLDLHDSYKMITFEFAKLDLSNPEGNRYRYRLEGFDDQWIDLRNRPEVTFTNLAPGSYKLHVQAADQQGIWEAPGATVAFQVRPAWYKTTWFRGLIAMAVVTAAFYLLWLRNKQKERILGLRNRISQDLHDEIGATLSSISLFGAVALKHTENQKGVVGTMLHRMESNTTQVMESMNDIVWAIRTDNDRVKDVVNRMRAWLTDLTEASDWEFVLEYDDAILDLPLSMIHRRNIYMIFKESVNNAIKYAKGTTLTIRLALERSTLTIEVADNGCGFEETALQDKANLGGNGLVNMRRRAKELGGTLRIVSSPGKGTRVVLSCRTTREPQYH